VADSPYKVFSMNDCDWMAGSDLESCKAEYLRLYTSENAEDAFDEPSEVPAEKMKKYRFHGEPGENCEGERSFEEELERRIAEGKPFPQFFASTEY
jgi:hypothetical protein